MRTIGFIGTGEIAAPMVRHLHAKGHDIIVSARGADIAQALAAEVGVKIAENQQVVDAAETVFLCLRPHVAQAVLDGLAFRAGQQIISVMADLTRATLQNLCAPATDFVQTIPLAFVQDGGCPLAAFGNTDGLARLFSPENPIVPVRSEAALNAHFAICAMVPGVLDLMAASANWLGARSGDAGAADFYTSQLMGGLLSAMEKGEGGLGRARDALATEKTLSLQMVDALRADGARDAMVSALSGIEKRLTA